MGCRSSRAADVEVEESFHNHVDELELLGIIDTNSNVASTRTRTQTRNRAQSSQWRTRTGEQAENVVHRRMQRRRLNQMMEEAFARPSENQSRNQNQNQPSPNANANTNVHPHPNEMSTSNLVPFDDLSVLNQGRRRHWLEDVDHMDNIDLDLDLDLYRDRLRTRDQGLEDLERDHPVFLRRELLAGMPPTAAAATTTGGNGNDDGDNNNNNNNNNNNGDNGGIPNMVVLPTNGEQLDQLRSDLVTLERLFHTLLGQRLADGGTDGPGGIPMLPTAPSSSCPPAARHIVENLPTISISECDFEDDCNNNRECSICFLEHEVNDRVTRLPCGHFFHGECINEWLKKRCTCPICRWELETDDPLFELERVERMKSRRIRVKDHELDRLCIGGLQEMAGLKNVKNRAKLIRTIKKSKDIDIITKDKSRPQSHCKEINKEKTE
mmetsp:Transcript_24046/g.35785  ORF Transcript_24046/g.35785 Transcript_24046/m.35785 type:complete len:439 (-) Transcript_24046:274-1590(-)|eukprot:CAMPEP_0203673572 /NCGR_PEP_ID=MMETSP0090-20130426/13007_1 /ASSEMBLY_ACC=CAM_ASM_001088 /TAXON_ID=426623 /ORGANISM="Chaetoceros affinis, Strain CCMP159" /LENGTH=438 /DNA_ID=CAMNT_0050539259 /DNA_START=497 /DNA_END=1813 /DNA_ORIENTATION=+